MKRNRETYDAMKARQREKWKARLDAGLCTYCGSPLNGSGKTMCSKCLGSRNENTKGYYRAHKQMISRKQAQRYWARKDAGICVTCGKAPATVTSARCPACAKKQYETQLRYNASKRASKKSRENI